VPTPTWFDYALIRVVPRVEREEFVNVGAVLFAPTAGFLGLALVPRWAALRALAGPGLDEALIQRHLAAWQAVAEGRPEGGPVARLNASERFHWLTAPRSTLVQSGPVYTGSGPDPAAALAELAAGLGD
jgi:hypothetical protein